MIRGEIWWADYGIPYGSEPGFRRPVVIIQNDLFNRSRIHTTVVIPLTTNELLGEIPGNIMLKKKETKLAKDGVLLIPQIGVIDKRRLAENISKLSKETMEKVEQHLSFTLGMSPI